MATVRKNRGCGCRKSSGNTIVKGATGTGTPGNTGWSEKVALIPANRLAGQDAVGTATTALSAGATGNIVIEKFISWIGGTGTPPSLPIPPYIYKGVTGWTDITNATNVKGSSPVTTLVLPDTGWQNFSLRTGYPHINPTAPPQWRVIGNQIYFRNSLRIAPSSIGASAHQDSITVDTSYIDLYSGDEAVAFIGAIGNSPPDKNIPLGGTFPDINGGANITLPSVLPNTIYLTKDVLTRAIETTGGKRVGVLAYTNGVIITTDGRIIVSTITDIEISPNGSSQDFAGATHIRRLTSKVENGQYVEDLRTLNNSSNTTPTKSYSTTVFANTYKFNMDTAKASDLGGFNINLNNSFGYLT